MPRLATIAVLLFSLTLALAIHVPAEEAITKMRFASFKQKFSRTYASADEEAMRYNIFKDNLATVEHMNKMEGNTVFGVTRFMDLTPAEFSRTYLTYRPPAEKDSRVVPLEEPRAIPTAYDWAQQGATTPVYNQEQCGSCWAFSATEEIESMWYLKHKAENVTIKKLSMQQIVDCDKGNGDQGCNGGDTTTAYEYVIKAGGLDHYEDYTYAGVDQTCAFKPADIAVSVANWSYVTQDKNETQMLYYSAAHGPISICVDAASWQFYFGGIIRTMCGQSLDHCVQLTGWGQEKTALGETEYWLIRNSWGAGWGEKGFLKVERNKNLCGVADQPTIVETH